MSVLTPLPGDPEGLRAIADGLAATGATLDQLADVAGALRRGATWDGAAGEAFATHLAAVAPVLRLAADRYAAAAPRLRELAAAHDAAQRTIAAAITTADEADAAIASHEDRIVAAMSRGAGWDSPEVVALRQAQRRQVARRLAAEADHRRAWTDHEAADARCAAALAALAEDAIADPALYRFLHGLRSLGVGVSTLGGLTTARGAGSLIGKGAGRTPGLAAMTTVAGWATVLAELGLLVAFDEGSWTDLALSGVTTATGFAGGALKKGAIAGSVKGADGRVVNVTPYTTGRRVRLGGRAEAAARAAAQRRKFVLTTPPRTPAEKVTGTWAERARRHASARVEKAFLDDLRLAKAGGTVRMYAAGVTLQRAAPVVKKVTTSDEGEEHREGRAR